MKEREFCLWLRGVLDVVGTRLPTAEETALIARRLDAVFEHAAGARAPEPNQVPESSVGATPSPTLQTLC